MKPFTFKFESTVYRLNFNLRIIINCNFHLDYDVAQSIPKDLKIPQGAFNAEDFEPFLEFLKNIDWDKQIASTNLYMQIQDFVEDYGVEEYEKIINFKNN